MINEEPKNCNLCGGKVEYIGNEVIYGKKYGSGYCYRRGAADQQRQRL